MMLHRCAWHRKTFGYAAYLRVTRDGAWRVTRSDGICRPCRDVMLATARGAAPKSLPITRELARAAMAVTGVAAWLLVMLLFAGCENAELKRATARADWYRDLAEQRTRSGRMWSDYWRVKYETICGQFYEPTVITGTASPFVRRPTFKTLAQADLYDRCASAWVVVPEGMK